MDPAIPVLQTLTLADEFDNNIAQERMLTTLGGFFGALALLLAAVGLYGVMAHAVARRVREIGIRMALGARAGEVLWLILRETLFMVGIGALIGIPAALALTRLLGNLPLRTHPAGSAQHRRLHRDPARDYSAGGVHSGAARDPRRPDDRAALRIKRHSPSLRYKRLS